MAIWILKVILRPVRMPVHPLIRQWVGKGYSNFQNPTKNPGIRKI